MSGIDVPHPPPARWLLPALTGLAAVVMHMGSTLLHPLSRQLGSALSEAPGHLWGLWTTAERVFTHGPFVRAADVGYPEPYVRHLMDVINLLLFLPGYWALGGGMDGASLGWNLVHGGSVAIGALGCVALTRRLFRGDPLEPYAAAVMIAVFACNPFLLNHPAMGRTEYLPAALFPLFLALLHRWMRRPAGAAGLIEERPPWWVGVAAGLVLAAMALGGWYLAIFIALLVPPLSLGLATRLSPLESAWRLAFVAVLSAIPPVPALIALLKNPPEKNALDGLNAQMPLEIGQFASHTWPSQLHDPPPDLDAMHMGQPAYVGLAALALALIGVIWRPRQALGWLMLAIWAYMLATGPFAVRDKTPDAMGDPAHMPLWYIIQWVPTLRGVHDWSRIAVMAAAPMAVAAAWGALRLASWVRWPVIPAALLSVGVIADQATYPKRWSIDQPWFDARIPEAMLQGIQALPPGAIVHYPVDIQHRDGGGPEIRGTYYLWQLQHHRPIPGVPEATTDTTLAHSYLTRLIVNTQDASVAARGTLDATSPAAYAIKRPSNREIRCARLDVRDLRQRGYAGVAVAAQLTGGSDLAEYLSWILGPPQTASHPSYVWDLAKAPPPEAIEEWDEGPCDRPSLPNRIARHQKPENR